MDISPTVFFIAIFAILQVPITMVVALTRRKAQISLMDGGNDILKQRIRAHGNFTETVPITLLAMAAAEYSGASLLLLWIGGGIFLIARILHYKTVSQHGYGTGRVWGILTTLAIMLFFAGYALLAQLHIL